MRKAILSLILTVFALNATANAQGIEFLRGVAWGEAVAQAKAENKLIFVDFYTEWCGPCLTMDKTVFVLPEIGSFFNNSFINVKIDAEKGEGVTLAKRYNVRSYPTYAFIDPKSEQIVHLSGSRQEADRFLQTGKDALIPAKRSFYLTEQYDSGNRDRQLLIDYIYYQHSIYQTDIVRTAFKELIDSGAKLSDHDIWELFNATISGITPYLKEVSDNYSEYCSIFGKGKVDAKLKKETTYGDTAQIASLCDYDGKEFNLKLIKINNAVRSQQYDDAISFIDSMIADPLVDQQELISRLKFIVRVRYNPEELPDKWFDKCVEYLRYIAYNQRERDDAYIHQEYAAALEHLLIRYKNLHKLPNALTNEPAYGKKLYDMRSEELKRKPTK